MEPKIVFEDDELLVLEKPAGMVVNRWEYENRGLTTVRVMLYTDTV